jgi:hypothetical protein
MSSSICSNACHSSWLLRLRYAAGRLSGSGRSVSLTAPNAKFLPLTHWSENVSGEVSDGASSASIWVCRPLPSALVTAGRLR